MNTTHALYCRFGGKKTNRSGGLVTGIANYH